MENETETMDFLNEIRYEKTELIAIDEAEMEKYASPWGNRVFNITPELLKQLQEGKLVTEYPFDEYGYFIKLVK